MEFQGTVQGAAARKYAGYTYRKPVKSSVDIWQLDPERLHPAHEYPRSVNPPSQPSTQFVELANYSVRVGATGNDGMSTVQVWMLPNKYTAATKPMKVCEFKAAHAFTLRHEYRDEALTRTFREPYRHAGDAQPNGKVRRPQGGVSLTNVLCLAATMPSA